MKANAQPNGSGAHRAPRRAAVLPPEKRCTYRTQSGVPCRAARRKKSDRCIFHDKGFRKRRTEAQAARTVLDRRKTPDSREGIHALLMRNIEELREGKIEPRVANSIAYQAQALMANLPGLQRERSNLIPGQMEERLKDLIVDSILEKCEKEIRKAGPNAYPVKVAERMAKDAKERAAQDPAPAVAPGRPDHVESSKHQDALGTVRLPPPRVREVAPGVTEVIAPPRGMPVSLGTRSRDDDD